MTFWDYNIISAPEIRSLKLLQVLFGAVYHARAKKYKEDKNWLIKKIYLDALLYYLLLLGKFLHNFGMECDGLNYSVGKSFLLQVLLCGLLRAVQFGMYPSCESHPPRLNTLNATPIFMLPLQFAKILQQSHIIPDYLEYPSLCQCTKNFCRHWPQCRKQNHPAGFRASFCKW